MRHGGVLIVTLVASLLSACAPSPIKITPEQRNQFKNHPPLTVAYVALPPFRVYTKGEAIEGSWVDSSSDYCFFPPGWR